MFKNCTVPEMLEQIFCLIAIRWLFLTPTSSSVSIWHFRHFTRRYYRGGCSKDTFRKLVHIWKHSWKSKIKPELGIWLPSCSQPCWGIRVVTHVFWWVDRHPSAICFFPAKPACSTHQPVSYTEAPSRKSHLEILTLQCRALLHSKPDDFLAPHGSLVAHFQLCCCTRWKLLFDLLCLHTHLPFGKHLEVPIRLNSGDNLRLVGLTFSQFSSFIPSYPLTLFFKWCQLRNQRSTCPNLLLWPLVS